MGVTPAMVGEMTLDQIMVMALDKDLLKHRRRLGKATPAELAAQGIIPPQPEKSYAQILREQLEVKERRRQKRKQKREQRRNRQ